MSSIQSTMCRGRSPQRGQRRVLQPSSDNVRKLKRPLKEERHSREPSADRLITRSMKRPQRASLQASSPSKKSRTGKLPRIDMTPGDVEMFEVPSQDAPTTAEINDFSDTDIALMPEGSPTFENAASLPSPQARQQDGLFSKPQNDFGHDVPPDLSSPFTHFDTAHSRCNPVPPHFTTRPADMFELSLRPRRSNGSAVGDTVPSPYNNNFSADHKEGEEKFFDYIDEAGRRSPGLRDHEPWRDVPASYVPSHWPTGPRNLAPGRWVCPIVGCEHPVGPTEDGEGYSRSSLGPHIRTHDPSLTDLDIMFGPAIWDGMFGLSSTMKHRVKALREFQCRDLKGPAGVVIELSCKSSTPPTLFRDDIQRETDALIPYLEEIKHFERSTLLRDPTINDRFLRLYFRGDEMLEGAELEEEVDDEPVPQQSSSHLHSDSFWCASKELVEEMRRKELEEVRTASSAVKPEGPFSFGGMATNTDRSGGPSKNEAPKPPRQAFSYQDPHPIYDMNEFVNSGSSFLYGLFNNPEVPLYEAFPRFNDSLRSNTDSAPSHDDSDLSYYQRFPAYTRALWSDDDLDQV